MKNYLSWSPLLAKLEDWEPLFLYLVVSKNANKHSLGKGEIWCSTSSLLHKKKKIKYRDLVLTS